MSATIETFPVAAPLPTRGPEAAARYSRRAQEAFELLSRSITDVERTTLCEMAEIWLDMAEAALQDRP